MNIRFIRREGERVELGVKTRYENPRPFRTGAADEALKDVAEERVWIEPGRKQELSVAGLGPIEMTGEFMDHSPPLFFTPDDTVDPRANEFRIVSPVLIRGKELVFNFSGASSSGGGNRESAVMIYWPGEGRYIISSVPIDGAVQAQVAVSQIRFNLEGQDYLLLSAVPVTRSEHAWILHQRDYKPPDLASDGTDEGMLGGVDLNELRKH